MDSSIYTSQAKTGLELLSVQDLVSLCEQHGLPTSGDATELLKRLVDARRAGTTLQIGVPSNEAFEDFFGHYLVSPAISVDDVAFYKNSDSDDDDVMRDPQKKKIPPIETDSKELVKALRSSNPFFLQGSVTASLPLISMHTSAQPSKEAPIAYDLELPVNTNTIDRLWEEAKLAPHGRGTETVLDPQVRSCRYYDPVEFNITSEAWLKEFSDSENSELLESIRSALAPNTSKITANLYKMVLYRQGSFFKAHLDTQRSEDMFGTLLVEIDDAMRSVGWSAVDEGRSNSGRLTVAHVDGRKERMLRYAFQYACFFADCAHEVSEVAYAEEYRVMLVYNLMRSGTEVKLEKIQNEPMIAEGFRSLLSKYPSTIFAHLLSHQYGSVSVQPRFLKGRDAEIYQALEQCQDLEVMICPVEVWKFSFTWVDHYNTAEGLLFEGKPCWVTTMTVPIDPLDSQQAGFGILCKRPLEDLNVHFLEDQHEWSAKARADTSLTGNEGAMAALLYVHGAIFVKRRYGDVATKNRGKRAHWERKRVRWEYPNERSDEEEEALPPPTRMKKTLNDAMIDALLEEEEDEEDEEDEENGAAIPRAVPPPQAPPSNGSRLTSICTIS